MIARGSSAAHRTAGIAALAIAFCWSCGPHRFVLPAGSGQPAPEAASAWMEATTACRNVTTYTAELRVSGRAGALPLKGVKIQTGVTAADQMRLDALAFGRPVFILAGTGDRTTFLRLTDRHMLKARADDILDALTGLKLGPRALMAVLDGCGGQAPDVSSAARYGDVIAITTADARVFLRQQHARWRTFAIEVAGLHVDYRNASGDWPTGLRISSTSGQTPRVALSVSVGQIEVNAPIAAVAFEVNEPADAVPLTLEELRREGPLGGGHD